MGQKSIDEIKQMLDHYSLYLGMEILDLNDEANIETINSIEVKEENKLIELSEQKIIEIIKASPTVLKRLSTLSPTSQPRVGPMHLKRTTRNQHGPSAFWRVFSLHGELPASETCILVMLWPS